MTVVSLDMAYRSFLGFGRLLPAVVLVPDATGWVSQGGSRHRFLFLLDQDRLLLRWRLWACGQRSGVVQPPASVPGDHVHSRFAAAAPDRHGRPVGQRLVGTAIVVEGDPGADPGARRAARRHRLSGGPPRTS